MQRYLSPPDADSLLIHWHGSVALRCPPPVEYYVYLLHFHSRYYHAGHYLGVTACLDARLVLHKTGRGAKLMKAIAGAGITFELARLWKRANWEEARDMERALKKRHNGPGLCPLCRGELGDVLVAMRCGHWPLALFARPGRRQPLTRSRPVFVARGRREYSNRTSLAPDGPGRTQRAALAGHGTMGANKGGKPV